MEFGKEIGDMSGSTDNTTPNTSASGSSVPRRAVADVIAETFLPFDHQGVIVSPFEEEGKRDIKSKEGEFNYLGRYIY